MADPTTAPENTAADFNPNPTQPEPDKQISEEPAQPDPSSIASAPPPNTNPNTPPPSSVLAPPPPSIPPSFRPAAPPPAVATPQFTPVPNVNYQTTGVPPPGVSAMTPMMMPPAPATGSGVPQVPMASMPVVMAPYAMHGQPMRPYAPMPNGYPGIPQPVPHGAMPPPGVLRYPSPYAPMMRPAFPPRPLGAVGVIPPMLRPPVAGIRGPITSPMIRPPAVPSLTSTEKPQTTVYVGKISSTVENDFILSLLQLCGPVKSWKRPQDPTNGTLKGYGFCEFESAEGVLRALRLLNKLSVDGQELMLNVNQATREYLKQYVEKKVESSKNIKVSETEGAKKEEESASGAENNDTVKSSEESQKPSSDEQKKDGSETVKKEDTDATQFDLVIDEDREADREAIEKLTGMIEERLKNKPLPPPPPPPQMAVDGSGNSNSEQPSRSRDREPDGDVAKNDSVEDKNEDEKTAESKPSSEHDRTETGSPDRSRRHDRSRDRDRDLKREKERELERYEREREQERAKREKDREYRSREDDRRYKAREKEWEAREREKEHWRKREREKEKERAQERKWEVTDQEHDSDDGYGKKRKYKTSDDERKRRQREKEEDLADRLREEEEIAEAKRRAEEEQQKKQQEEELKVMSGQPANGHEKAILPDEDNLENNVKVVDQTSDSKPSFGNYIGEGVLENGTGDEDVTSSNAAAEARQNMNAPARKLGFGLLGSGKRTAVPSVFNEDEDEDAHKEKKMRPLVPIDYSTEEQQSVSETPSTNMAAAAEFAKRVITANSKEEKPPVEKEKGKRSHERSSQRDRDRDRDRHEEESYLSREESRKDNYDRERPHKVKTPENQKLLDAKQLIDAIPKTKDELFSYEINWAIYDQNALQERMRPWISKKITEFLGEEEVTLVDYIVSSTQEHVGAGEMFDRLQSILDDEAEMFVLKMWRMLIFEIKKVETGIALRSRA
ncbi:splicing factor PWI domain-containing protein/RNA recognition motif (RRM)-containing protein [Forsythia ovata]|uniref:Splicing factor PWI domain-containing protein/RNA recognition motif (RRM)-containing protein n=1 Tax=Forsythia ovata TaxID=205694 RepID=A0ABD1TCE4_9LAMI